MMTATEYQDYGYSNDNPNHMFKYLLEPMLDLMGDLTKETRILDVGCGNGYLAGCFLKKGCSVVGIDLSDQGISLTRSSYPTGRFEVMAADNQILQKF
jgi:2-polyprenyl-3-methyl-5-hydroxy-6-metoxy-1,4-benzoquinol methylase